jgi:hypothetical protein
VEAKSFLTSRGISFEERDIRSNPEYLRILNDELDSCTTPTLVADDTIITGFDQAEYQCLPVVKAAVAREKYSKQDFPGTTGGCKAARHPSLRLMD